MESVGWRARVRSLRLERGVRAADGARLLLLLGHSGRARRPGGDPPGGPATATGERVDDARRTDAGFRRLAACVVVATLGVPAGRHTIVAAAAPRHRSADRGLQSRGRAPGRAG